MESNWIVLLQPSNHHSPENRDVKIFGSTPSFIYGPDLYIPRLLGDTSLLQSRNLPYHYWLTHLQESVIFSLSQTGELLRDTVEAFRIIPCVLSTSRPILRIPPTAVLLYCTGILCGNSWTFKLTDWDTNWRFLCFPSPPWRTGLIHLIRTWRWRSLLPQGTVPRNESSCLNRLNNK